MMTPPATDRDSDARICVSVAIIAWNEEEAIEAALQSLCQQTLFHELGQRGLRAEVICMANACTDRTAELARRFFEKTASDPVMAQTLRWRVIEVSARGKNNSWNLFVHHYSATNAACLCFMDADIVLHGNETLWRMYCTLEQSPNASVTVDQPLKDIALNGRKSLAERISLATSGMTRTALAQLSGQLYFIRAPIARKIHLPRDLAACEDGFIKALVCTDFLTNELCPDRVRHVDGAAHIFQSYRTFRDVLRNQKRQMIGQTIVHILIDQYLKELPMMERLNMAQAIQSRENMDRDWLKRLIAAHLCGVKYFWRLFPNLLRFRYERWRALPIGKRMTHFPSALAGFGITLLASRMAFRFLKQGSINYWPDTRSPGLKQFVSTRAPASSSEQLLTPTVQP